MGELKFIKMSIKNRKSTHVSIENITFDSLSSIKASLKGITVAVYNNNIARIVLQIYFIRDSF
jgi:hypothetical protein